MIEMFQMWALIEVLGLLLLPLTVTVFHNLPDRGWAFSKTLCLVGLWRMRATLLKFVRLNRVYILFAEVVFLGMVFLLGWLRSYGPEIRSYEMFMDEGFIAAIMRSPHM